MVIINVLDFKLANLDGKFCSRDIVSDVFLYLSFENMHVKVDFEIKSIRFWIKLNRHVFKLVLFVLELELHVFFKSISKLFLYLHSEGLCIVDVEKIGKFFSF